LTFGSEGEETLSGWLADNAAVVWCECERPWLAESSLVEQLVTPLNLKGNESHPYFRPLSQIRRDCRRLALEENPPLAAAASDTPVIAVNGVHRGDGDS
jgi:hypothetical protein